MERRRLLSGQDCVTALAALGFAICHAGKGTTMLKRAGRIVMVPHVEELTGELLDAIARSAGVHLDDLVMATRTRSGTHPRFSMGCAPGGSTEGAGLDGPRSSADRRRGDRDR